MSVPRLHLRPLSPLPLTLALTLGFAASAQAQSLMQLYDSARTYDATYQAAQQQAKADRALADQSRSLLLPSVGLGASYTRANTTTSNPTSSSSANQSNVGVQANIPIFNAANWDQRKKAKESVKLVDIQLRAAEQDLMVRTAQAYFDLLSARDALKLARSQKEALAQQLAFAKRNFEVGTATITDSREAQAGYDLAAAQESAATYAEQTKYSALVQLVGKDAITPWQLVSPFTPPALENETVQYWQDLAAKSDAVQAARVQYDMAKLSTQAARAGHLPTVTGTLAYSDGRAPNPYIPTIVGDTRSRTTSATISMNVPIFAGFAIQDQVRQNLALENKAKDTLDATERSMAQNTREAFFGVQSLKAQVNALEAAEKSSQSSLDANKLGYEVGVRINIDVLNAQTQLYNTQNQLAKARYDLLTSELKLKQAVGTLTQADMEKVNGYLRAPSAEPAAPASATGAQASAQPSPTPTPQPMQLKASVTPSKKAKAKP